MVFNRIIQIIEFLLSFGKSKNITPKKLKDMNSKVAPIEEFASCLKAFSDLAIDVILEDIDEDVLYIKGDVTVNDWKTWEQNAFNEADEIMAIVIDGNLTVNGDMHLHNLILVTGNVSVEKFVVEDQSFATGGNLTASKYVGIMGTNGPHIDIKGITDAPYIMVQNQVSVSLTPSNESLMFKVGEITEEFANCFIEGIRQESGEGSMKYFYTEMRPLMSKVDQEVYPFTKPKDEILAILKAHPSYQSGLLSDSHESFYKE
ncbi:hypothetical protein MG290_09825 [Flavobacterium sp. CBA20B-1]|uniref:hypothetical protein n=1 Tax=unclassified Flavobacterium TaxID=196869 RepID=UPI002224C654|nr:MULTISPECIES: hypothetical protein [unclassified Flavobacterium]WCM41255.1 hypothetical protein MG290_09825 [Flavobacterium sp. CBA20B-1]